MNRNDPCECGSGKKFKKCCLRLYQEYDNAIEKAPEVIQQSARIVGNCQNDDEIGQRLGFYLDQLVVEVVGGRAACAKGCGCCCRINVDVFPFEVERIVRYLNQHVDAGVLGKVKESAKGNDPACPMLINEECAVYPIRPLACRQMWSTDKNSCRRELIEDGPMEPWTNFPGCRVLWEAVEAGLIQAGKGGFKEPLRSSICKLLLNAFDQTTLQSEKE